MQQGTEPDVSRDSGILCLHASAVAVGGRALLILGASGSGKSGLALRLMALGAELVADDRVLVERRGAGLVARAPAALAGLIEARGVGILRRPHLPEAVPALAVTLDFAPAARMPQREAISYLGVALQLIFGRDVPNIDPVLMFVMQNDRRVPE